MKSFRSKTILITGGTGSFGQAFVREILDSHRPESVRIFSRDELKQLQMRQSFEHHPLAGRLRFFIGDVRDSQRLHRAAYKTDVIVHAAALKQVPVCEADPIEAVRTNVNGAINVIDAALDNNVKKIIALSTDKASQPINLYGATKLCSDKLFIQANNYRGDRKTAFSVVRYGNVIGSRGSVVPLFLEQSKNGSLTLTDPNMTRFWVTLPEAVKFVISSLRMMQGGELFVPKLPSMKVADLARAIAPKAKVKAVGIRPGEKLHESLISSDEARLTKDLGDRYMIEPAQHWFWQPKYRGYSRKKSVPANFSYSSDSNSHQLGIREMRRVLKQLA